MTVNELIQDLTRMAKAHGGDLEVVDENDNMIDAVEFNDDNNDPVIVVVTA